ncbi:MAG: hypothetical protein GF353_06555 [Candidatus Lokiarchaeota archaeon]|nr:hypothetical protein [Candidatus Lokiarchaeota archaeon]
MKYFKNLFLITILILVTLLFLSIIQDTTNLTFVPWFLWDITILITFSIIAQGIILLLIYILIKKTAQHNDAVILKKYHIHEGIVGIIFIGLAIALIIYRGYLIRNGIFHPSFTVLLMLTQFLLFLTLFFGSFFILRDWKDVLKLKFIEKIDPINCKNEKSEKTSVFNRINEDDVEFFASPRLLLYPLGILFTSISINLIVYGTGILFQETYLLRNDTLIFIGYFLCILAGAIIGLDWFRVFKKLYPELFYEIEKVLSNL